ncbi:thioredoxin reductase [Aureimonas altamirensis]|uniref:Thioredoxin reductase n=1 Tax=Aureimonas altamirensis TaxID=370622 RepID=A0A0B1Q462_9HYPH|nr:NAD(P)/FAD-dependent oxidoreductase [Aureimonas altamirensis]KHJ53712.1 thioredoxin reductase [Aureimonas altamirensis]
MAYDAIIIGGSFAGLSAAMYLGRARRSVCVLDTAKPRNRFAEASHGQFAHDGSNPQAMLATMRAQVAAYPTVRFVDAAAVDAARDGDAFTVILADGDVLSGARILLAFGITDMLPDLPGLVERWGQSVLHCPYCHGYEFRDQRLGVLNLSPMSAHQAMLIPEWGPTTFFLNGGTIDPETAAGLEQRGVTIDPARVQGLIGEGGNLSAIQLADGREQPLDALYIGPPYRFSSDIAEHLGCTTEDGMLGPVLTVDEMKATNIAGVYAAGDITRMAHSVTFACADGVMAALAIHRSLVFGAIA